MKKITFISLAAASVLSASNLHNAIQDVDLTGEAAYNFNSTEEGVDNFASFEATATVKSGAVTAVVTVETDDNNGEHGSINVDKSEVRSNQPDNRNLRFTSAYAVYAPNDMLTLTGGQKTWTYGTFEANVAGVQAAYSNNGVKASVFYTTGVEEGDSFDDGNDITDATINAKVVAANIGYANNVIDAGVDYIRSTNTSSNISQTANQQIEGINLLNLKAIVNAGAGASLGAQFTTESFDTAEINLKDQQRTTVWLGYVNGGFNTELGGFINGDDGGYLKLADGSNGTQNFDYIDDTTKPKAQGAWVTLGYEAGKYSATVVYATNIYDDDYKAAQEGEIRADLGYKFEDNLKLTVSPKYAMLDDEIDDYKRDSQSAVEVDLTYSF